MGRASKARVSATRAVGPYGQTRSVPEAVVRQVWIAAGGRCTICNRYLAEDEYTGQDVSIGQLAHIVGWSTSPGSPRGGHELPHGERNLSQNLMLLCYDQHKVIDDKSLWEFYGVEALRALKRRHEQRIRRLTGLREENKTTVVRVVGNLHGRPVELTRSRVAAALLERDRFPDWELLGEDEFEVDLRALPGEPEGTSSYWAAAREHLEDRLGHLRTQVRRGTVTHLSVFALARMPVLIMLGTLLDETLPTDFYPKRRDGAEGWGWSPGAPTVEFDYRAVRQRSSTPNVAVLLSVSASIDPNRLPPEIDDSFTVYEILPAHVLPEPSLITSAESLDHFCRIWRRVLAVIESEHPQAPSINVVPAVPAAAAVSIGRHVFHAAQPPLRIYDRSRDEPSYRFMASTGAYDFQKGEPR